MDKLSLFKDMHFQSELLFLPNAWDVVSAMVLEQAGFKAIGTTSYGVARAMGYEDGQRIEFDDLLGLVKKMISIIGVPITVDMEAGYSNNIITVSHNVMKVADLCASGIIMGHLATYGSIAQDINTPKAHRAVGTAIGKNPIAFLIPCHRVIQSSGNIGGYMWGSTRKSAMIGWEASKVSG